MSAIPDMPAQLQHGIVEWIQSSIGGSRELVARLEHALGLPLGNRLFKNRLATLMDLVRADEAVALHVIGLLLHLRSADSVTIDPQGVDVRVAFAKTGA
jgi:hypothetical protein